MGKPNAGNAALFHTEYIGMDRAPGEVKHLSTQRKRKRICSLYVYALQGELSSPSTSRVNEK